jgi:outer membrane lipoprotein-sorting protein
MTRSLRILTLFLGLGTFGSTGQEAGERHDGVLRSWLAASTHLTSFEAEFRQTRHLKALTEPLTSTGRVWFLAPDQFRWEIGNPPQSIALRSRETLVVLSPRLKRAETYSLSGATAGPAKDLMGLLDGAFPRSLEEWKRRFEVAGVSTNQGVLQLELRPRSAAARKLMPTLIVGLDPASHGLRLTEMVMADGSRIRSEFHSLKTNVPVSPDLFRAQLDGSWKTTQNEVHP